MNIPSLTKRIHERAAASKCNHRGFVSELGLSANTLTQANKGAGISFSTLRALFGFLDTERLPSAERFIELEISGEEIVAMRKSDFAALQSRATSQPN